MFVDLNVHAPAGSHREGSLLPGSAQIESSRDTVQQAEFRYGGAGCGVYSAEQRLEIGRNPRRLANRHARTQQKVGYGAIQSNAVDITIVNSSQVRNGPEPATEVVHELAAPT